jgi:putative ABC transport system permease protein
VSDSAPAFVWLSSVADLRWRWRRFLIAAVAAALVLGLTVLLTGFVQYMDLEVRRTLDAIGAHGFVVPEGNPGPFTSISPIPLATGDEIEDVAEVGRVDPMVLLPQTIEDDPPRLTFIFGYTPGGLGEPPVESGRLPTALDELVVDGRAGLEPGDEMTIGGTEFTVVGETKGLTIFGRRPNVYMHADAARAAFIADQPLVSAFAVDAEPAALPDGLTFIDLDDAKADLKRPLRDAIASIALFRTLLWLVAAAIVGSVLYLSALERARDMAVMKATGVGGRSLVLGLMLQAAVLSLVASAIAIVFAEVLKPMFPAGISLPITLLLTVPVVSLVVGIIGSLVGLRRVLKVDPAMAFGGP